MADQDMQFSSDPVFSCDVCGEKCSNQNGLTKHKNSPSEHNELRSNEKNEIEFVSSVCENVFTSRMGLYCHQRAKHRKTIDAPEECTEDVMETTTIEDVHEGDGNLRKEISHEKECVVEISTSMALGSIQDAVKREFR